jgi:hypothetical protein
MAASVERARETPGALASVVLHVAFAGLLLAAARLQPPVSPSQESVAVEILTPQEFEAATGRTDVAPDESVPLPAPPAEAARPVPMVRPNIMLSERTLADPRSRQARAALGQMTADERMVQLCDVEAMAQIAAWRKAYEPDRVVDQATAETRIDGVRVIADGAAFRSDRAWYGLKFRCELTADLTKVAAFEFSVGEAIPREDWEELGLAAVH